MANVVSWRSSGTENQRFAHENWLNWKITKFTIFNRYINYQWAMIAKLVGGFNLSEK